MRGHADSAFVRSLRGLARSVCRHPTWLLYPQILLSAGAFLYAFHGLSLDTNRDDLIGARMKSQQLYLAFEKEFPGEGDDLVVIVQSGRLARSRQFIERLAAKVKPETNLFCDLFYKADVTTLGPKGLLLGSASDLEQMRNALRQYLPLIDEFSRATNLNSLFALVNKQFRTAPFEPTAQTESLVAAVPFVQSIISQAGEAMLRPGRPPPPEIEALFSGGAEADSQIYVTLAGGRILLLTVRSRTEAMTLPAINRLRQLIRATQIEVPGVDVGLTGGPVLDAGEMRQAEHDTARASLVAFFLCALLFIAAYRQLWRPLKAALCLIIGLGYTMGFATLAIGSLNILTITFAPMLIGLAIDFGIHFISRFEEEMRNRLSVAEAIEKATAFTGQGIVTGAVTTAVAFLAMALTSFKGIREMGVISGCGLMLCLVPMLTALPVLLAQGAQNLRDRQIGPTGQRRLQIELLWLKHPLWVLGAMLLLCLGAALEIHHVRFDYDLLHMQSQSLPSVVYEKKLLRAGGASSLYGAVIADSLAQARSYEQRLKRLPAVADVRSVADFLEENQTEKLALARSIRAELAGIHFAPMDPKPVAIEPLSATLWYLTGYLGLAADTAQPAEPALARELRSLKDAIVRFRVLLLERRPGSTRRLTAFQQAFFQGLHKTFKALQNQDTRGPMRPQDLPPSLRSRFIGVTGKYLVQVYPKKDLWRHANQQAFINQLRSAVPADRVTGTPVQLYEYTTLLKNSYEQAAVYALAAIILMTLVRFRSLVWVMLALLPVGVGSTWLLGFMGRAGIPFNPANIMTLPLVLGIGVTNGVQILNRFSEERNPAILAKSTGKAVLVSGLTAIAGFGSLILANHQGIRSLGIVMSVGIAACMVAALTVLPALLRLLLHQERVTGQPELAQ